MKRVTIAYTAPLLLIAVILFSISFVVPNEFAPLLWTTGIIVFVMFGILLTISNVKRIKALRQQKNLS